MPRDRFEVTVEVTFAASHQLRGYKADLEPLHGHNFRVEAFVDAAPCLVEVPLCELNRRESGQRKRLLTRSQDRGTRHAGLLHRRTLH